MVTSDGLLNGTGHQEAIVDPHIASLAEQLGKLRADIVAGKHARFRVPVHLSLSAPSSGGPASSSGQSLPVGTNSPAVISSSAAPIPTTDVQSTANPNSLHAYDSTSDPKQVLQKRRQELENVLLEQLQQKRLASKLKTCDQEIIADFDVNEVLRKAHERVRPWEPSDPSEADQAASSSDSFDENTFYSSQMNESTTPEDYEPHKKAKRPLRACRFFRDGRPCPYGAKCTFSHDPAVVKQVEIEEQQKATGQNRVKEQGNRGNPSPGRKPSDTQAAAAANPQVPDDQAVRIAELEEQLRQMKEQQRKPPVVPRAVEKPENEQPQIDEFGRDSRRRENYRDETRDIQPVQVARNHITSPYAPQPARISPLTGQHLPQIARIQRIDDTASGSTQQPVSDSASNGQSPTVAAQRISSKKRRRAANKEDDARNVAPRTGRVVSSPDVHIKAEPVSPPPFDGKLNSIPDLPPLASAGPAAPSQDQIYRAGNEGPYIFQSPMQEQRANTPSRRVVSGNGQPVLAPEDTNLRRIASTRQLRAAMSPGLETAYRSPQSRTMRAASQVQFTAPGNIPPPAPYRASVQPAFRERRSQPRQIELKSDRPPSVAMAPPSRRIVVDQYGHKYVEETVPERSFSVAAAPERQVQYEPQYEEVPSSHHSMRRMQPTMYEQDGRYYQEVEAPTSPRYVDYAGAPGRKQIIRLEQDRAEQEAYANNTHVVRYEPRTVSGYNGPGEDGLMRMEHVRPVDERIENIPPENPARVPSARPQPRLVRLGAHEENRPRMVRQVSLRPGEQYLGGMQRMPADDLEAYGSHGDDLSQYPAEPAAESMYEPPRTGSRRIVRV